MKSPDHRLRLERISHRLAALAAVVLMLAGCGERAAAPQAPADPHPPATLEPASIAQPGPLEDTTRLDVIVEGETEAREARLWVSPQGYAIYVLPQIVMTEEEPGRDQAFARVDGEFFVRIERLDPQAYIGSLRNNARLALRDIGRVYALQGEDIFDPLFREAEFFLHASDPTVRVNLLVVEIDGSRFRIMMHIPNREAAEGIVPSFWAMLRSIRTVGPLPTDDQPADDQPAS
jgi:hypothetical protein